RAGNAFDQSLNCFGGALVLEEVKDDAYRFFCDSITDAGFCGQLANQFVHLAPPRPVVNRVSLLRKTSCACERRNTRDHRVRKHNSSSFALQLLQQCKSEGEMVRDLSRPSQPIQT